MKAINPKFQEALDKFTANDFWRTVYENAPNGAKALHAVLPENQNSNSMPSRLCMIRPISACPPKKNQVELTLVE